MWPFTVGKDFASGNYLFRAVKLTKNASFVKCKYSGYGIGFDARRGFSLSNGSGFGKNVIIVGVDMSSFADIDNKKNDILILGKGPADGLDEITLTAEKWYSVNFTDQQKSFCLSLHYNGVNSCIFVNGIEIYKFKAKDFKINVAPLYLGSASKDFLADNMKETGLHGYVYDFSVDYDNIDVADILDIHKYLMKKHDIK